MEMIDQDIVLLRGLAREAGHWGGFLAQLKACWPRARLHTLELPGTGRFHQQSCPLHPQELLDHLSQQLPQHSAALGIGMSFGGMLLLQWLLRQPGYFGKLVVINSSIAGVSPAWQRLKPSAWPLLWQLQRAREPWQREQKILEVVMNRPRQHQRRQWQEVCAARPVSRANMWRHLLLGARCRLEQPPKGEVLCLSSAADRLVSPRCSADLATYIQGQHRQHPWAGHDLTADDPAWVLQQIQKFTGAECAA